ncbi:LysM peptidoglycan-binding domain-containing protein [Cellulomonas sp. NPDC089187]|uniref:LysM peptidoglycan-binding domain-containing protein n=1 Tax=Cellulomonas sp. NPDC089187 TaxID=3154970 RepID=UPI0034394D25
MSTIAAQPHLIGVPRSRGVRQGAPTRDSRAAASTRSSVTAPTESTRLHLTRRGRIVVVLLGLLLAAGGVMGGRAVAEGPVRATEVETYAVQSGDTLWSIAQGVAQPGEDVRDVVIQLQRLNDLNSGSLVAGQVLMLPAAG